MEHGGGEVLKIRYRDLNGSIEANKKVSGKKSQTVRQNN